MARLYYLLVAVGVTSHPWSDDREGKMSSILIPTNPDSFDESLSGELSLRSDLPCGIRRSSIPDAFTRVVGGAPAEKHEFPWQVSIQWKFVWYTYHVCGGSVVNQNWIATAAHCIHQFNEKDVIVVAGDYKLKQREGTEQTRNVEKIVQHPKYRANTQENDIALIKLSKPLTMDGLTVSPICLPDNVQKFSGDCVVSGWGKIKESGRSSDDLLKVVLPIIDHQKCIQSYRNIGYSGPLTEEMICAGYDDGGRDACQGDSGGPFVCRGDDRRHYLTGIVSWGVGCARPNIPGVYTNVGKYIGWIESTMAGKAQLRGNTDEGIELQEANKDEKKSAAENSEVKTILQ